MQRGEKIISQKRKKIRAINRISFSVSGLCAALAVIFFINNTDIDNIDKDNMNNSDIIITTTEKFVEHDKKTTEISTNHTISADNKIYSAATTACTSEITSSETAFTEHISSETTEAVSCIIIDETPHLTQSEGIYEDTEISSISQTVSIHAMAIFCQSSHSDTMSIICTLNFTLKILHTECFVCATAYFYYCQDAVTL